MFHASLSLSASFNILHTLLAHKLNVQIEVVALSWSFRDADTNCIRELDTERCVFVEHNGRQPSLVISAGPNLSRTNAALECLCF